MRMVYIGDEDRLRSFAKEAAKHFEEHDENNSYSSGDIKQGDYLALRWGLGRDCVLVILIGENFEPVIYQQLIGGVSNVR